MVELPYFTCVFLVVGLFLWYQGQGQILWSQFSKNGCCSGIHVSQTLPVKDICIYIDTHV